MNLPAGILADRHGRKLLLVWGPAITALGTDHLCAPTLQLCITLSTALKVTVNALLVKCAVCDTVHDVMHALHSLPFT